MDENKFQWLAEFILECLTPEEKARVTAKANERWAQLSTLVEKHPLLPATTAEHAIEHYLFNMVEE